MQRKSIGWLIVTLTIGLAANDLSAATLTLLCKGKMNFYRGGFGEEVTSTTQQMVITVDLDKKQAQSTFPMGSATTPLRSVDDQWIAFDIPRNARYENAEISTESVSINRITGEVNSYYNAVVNEKSGIWFSYRGICEAASRKF